ncbi:uncharacterized protein TRIVIDRAFT_67436 [Trichoderma virens Gv29-8]|uniref:Uncharacterized protein n=1 Tax=Hypocrea virens (strain Gv29-8 / FGSC 10586) TaxID=413071 RepID=G9N649_HYPVG|nr:uncharacterized protein TRIVIDRAFT_67436 [Trichoderma virens Gv29-8]EHK18239.1 hypothetical protein TRIVIDRAFT_67436 [Trichoderma virens Gv29-8]UKZ53890.1 hypothetical protein TrVGV298_007692 [Trichoderma virens]
MKQPVAGTRNPPPRDYGTLWRLPERIMARRPQEKDAASKLEVLGWLKRQAQNQKVPQHYASHAVAAKPLAACPPAATGPPKPPTQVIRHPSSSLAWWLQLSVSEYILHCPRTPFVGSCAARILLGHRHCHGK